MSRFMSRAILGLFTVVSALPVAAADLTFILDRVVTGSPGLTGSPVATINNLAGGTAVELTMQLLDIAPDVEPYDVAWWFNLRPSLDPSSLSFAFDSGSTGGQASVIETGANALTTPGAAGNFDMVFRFETKNRDSGTFRFNSGEFVRYTISRAAGLSASDFDFANDEGFLSVTKINGLAAGSVTVGAAVPEPGIVTFLGVLAAGILVWIRKVRQSTA